MENSSSERKSVLRSVAQGSILGPLLFVLLINDIDSQLKRCFILLYADDMVIFPADKTARLSKKGKILTSTKLQTGSLTTTLL